VHLFGFIIRRNSAH